jgi:hypothetical protein
MTDPLAALLGIPPTRRMIRRDVTQRLDSSAMPPAPEGAVGARARPVRKDFTK